MGKLVRLVLLFSVAAGSVLAAPKIKNIKLAVANPTDTAMAACDVVIPIADLRKVAPDLTPALLIVTATDASTVEADAAVLATDDLPSQVDDLNDDGKADELAFQIDLAPRQTRIVTVSYGDQERILRLRRHYPLRTDALFSNKIEGLGWESDRIAFRIYFDPRNAIDIYAKRRRGLQLKLFATPNYNYHGESPEGRDIFGVGQAIGIGGVAGWVDGKLVKVADVKQRNWRILSTGPVRSIVELEYSGWNLAGKTITLRSRITQWAGEHGFYQTVTTQDPTSASFVTGMPNNPGIPAETSHASGDAPTWLATWGQQVVDPGTKALTTFTKENLGLAVITNGAGATTVSDSQNHLLKFSLHDGAATWYAMAAWDQEDTERQTGYGNPREMQGRESMDFPSDAITTRDAFLAAVQDQSLRMASPAQFHILSAAPESQSAPPDTLTPRKSKSVQEAIDLLRQAADRTAKEWEPILRENKPGTFSSNSGKGFFTEGDNNTGEWHPEKGYFWTGGFWTGELWRLYQYTHDEKYRQWAQLWGKCMTGQEMEEDHDVGFLYYYSAAQDYDITHDAAMKESALRAAARLEELYNPKTHLIASWSVNGDDTIIDTLMNLQLLWWTTERTGDKKWSDIGRNHAARTQEWFVRPDGSTKHSVHYNPGDNRQYFETRGSGLPGTKFKVPNDAPAGAEVFSHTHQGFAADSAWSRGEAWALYGFTAAYAATKDPQFLATADKIAAFILDNLPADDVPWYDFDDEGVHFRNRDSSAAAISAAGLFRLSELTPDKDRATLYRGEGERMVHSLIDHYLTPVAAGDQTPPGVLRHGSSTRPDDAMLVYGQYYLLDDLLWMQQHSRQ